MPASNYLTIRGAAERVGVVHGTIQAAIGRGELSASTTQCGKATLLRVRDVDRWAAQERRRGPKKKTPAGA